MGHLWYGNLQMFGTSRRQFAALLGTPDTAIHLTPRRMRWCHELFVQIAGNNDPQYKHLGT
jgi:hypothetical protein